MGLSTSTPIRDHVPELIKAHPSPLAGIPITADPVSWVAGTMILAGFVNRNSRQRLGLISPITVPGSIGLFKILFETPIFRKSLLSHPFRRGL